MRKTKNKFGRWRDEHKLSLDAVCDLLAGQGLKRPSAAKVSRIEWGQKVPPEMLKPLERVTGIPAKELRPDLAEIFAEVAQ